jgi:uncharacterized membrane protein
MINSVSSKIKNFRREQWFLSILLALLITDLIILLDVNLLKQSIPFIFFTIIPGLIIVNLLKLHKLEFEKKVVLWIGLSISLLLFTGLLLNSLYPMITKPLAMAPVLVTLNIEVVLLAFLEYHRNKESFNMKDIFNFQFDSGKGLLSPVIFPFIFPVMAILGTYLMNTYENNLMILGMLFLIPAYLIVIFYLKERVNPVIYPISLWLISLGLLLMHA